MPKFFTVADAAAELDLNRSRISALCVKHDIGTLVSPRLRVLSAADMRRLRTIRKPPGRPKLRRR